MRVRIALGIVAIVVLAACSPNDTDSEPATTGPEPVTTTAPTTTLPLVAGCPDEGEFVEDGTIASFDQDQSDSSVIGQISWRADEACETFTFSFVTSEGAPATTPPTVTAAYVEGVPVIRVAVDADQTIITDQLVETGLIDRLYVVRALEGGSFIDLHLAAPAQARVHIGGSPARITLDLQPGIVEYSIAATVSDLVVVVTPLDTDVVRPTTEVTGYARTFESNVMIIATAGDQLVAEMNTTAAGGLETWGEFRALVVLPLGEVSLFVGDENGEDGGLEGVTISLTVR